MKTTAALLLALAFGSACTTYRAPQPTTVTTCVDPARPCDSASANNYGWAQDALRLSSR